MCSQGARASINPNRASKNIGVKLQPCLPSMARAQQAHFIHQQHMPNKLNFKLSERREVRLHLKALEAAFNRPAPTTNILNIPHLVLSTLSYDRMHCCLTQHNMTVHHALCVQVAQVVDVSGDDVDAGGICTSHEV